MELCLLSHESQMNHALIDLLGDCFLMLSCCRHHVTVFSEDCFLMLLRELLKRLDAAIIAFFFESAVLNEIFRSTIVAINRYKLEKQCH